MKMFFRLLVVTLLCFSAFAALGQSSTSPMTNASVVKLVRAGFKEKTVIAIIHSRPNRFDLEPERLIDLKRNGVSENIILAMLAQNDASFLSADDWSFSRSDEAGKSTQGEKGSADIFGGGSGSSGATRGRGMRGSNDRERTTTGSATVRILKPPPDDSGGRAKLERIPTLTNDSIVNLVDAGFSEGTIIKRIEESPVDFDLSQNKIEELRRHRVGDGVITAMRNAMREAPIAPGSNPQK